MQRFRRGVEFLRSVLLVERLACHDGKVFSFGELPQIIGAVWMLIVVICRQFIKKCIGGLPGFGERRVFADFLLYPGFRLLLGDLFSVVVLKRLRPFLMVNLGGAII